MNSVKDLIMDELKEGWKIEEYKTGEIFEAKVNLVHAVRQLQHNQKPNLSKTEGKWMLMIYNPDGSTELNFLGPALYEKLKRCLISFENCWEELDLAGGE